MNKKDLLAEYQKRLADTRQKRVEVIAQENALIGAIIALEQLDDAPEAPAQEPACKANGDTEQHLVGSPD